MVAVKDKQPLAELADLQNVRIRYTRFVGKVEDLVIEPLSVAVYEHQLYVLGRSQVDGIHPYRLSRIDDVVVQSSRFRYPERTEYDPEQMFASSFGIHLGRGPLEDIRVRLAPNWQTYALTHRWHPAQRAETTSQGVVVTIPARLSPEVTAWVLSFGGDAEVLGPVALRRDVARHAAQLARTYARRRSGHQRPSTRRGRRSISLQR